MTSGETRLRHSTQFAIKNDSLMPLTIDACSLNLQSGFMRFA